MNRVIVLTFIAVIASVFLLPGCRTSDATPPPASATGMPAATRTPLSPTATSSPDLQGTADAAWAATLQAGQTQNAAHLATSAAELTAAAEERAANPTRTPRPPTPLPPTAQVTLVPITPIAMDWNSSVAFPIEASAPFSTDRGQQLVIRNGYVYVFGGLGQGYERVLEVFFSSIRPDGSLAGWVNTTPLPDVYDLVALDVGDFVYLLTGAAGQAAVYYAPFNPDGSIGSWSSTGQSLTPSRQSFAAVAYGDFIYVTGGNDGGTQTYVQYASVRPDGGLDPWKNTTSLPVPIQDHTMVAHDGYVYVFGGRLNSDARIDTVIFAEIRPDGGLGVWQTTTPLPFKQIGFSTFVSKGDVYLVGAGESVYVSRILPGHGLSAWVATTPLPVPRYGLRAGAYNGFAYAVGGFNLSAFVDTVYYALLGGTIIPPPTPGPHCAEGWSRLTPGMYADVAGESTGTPNRVRSAPDGTIIALIYPGHRVLILEGPVCTDGLVFWKVSSDAIPGGEGWTAEGDGTEYWLDPVIP